MGKTDWGSKESLQDSAEFRKKWKDEGDEDRTAEYQRFRRGFGHGAYVTDIDQVEYRRDEEGAIYAVCTLELTRIDGGIPPDSYFASILKRYNDRDDQGRTARTWAWLLGIPCYIVAYMHDLSSFYVYNLTANEGWWNYSTEGYRRWLIDMRREK